MIFVRRLIMLKEFSILFLIFFSIFFVFNFENSFASLFSYNSNPLNILWNTASNALAFDTDSDGIIDTVYSSNTLASPTQTWTKVFGNGITPLSQTFGSAGTFTGLDISVFPENQIGVATSSINSGCAGIYSVKNILTGVYTVVHTGGSGTISGSNCHVSTDFMKRTDNRYAFFTYYANTGDGVCKFEVKANTTSLHLGTTSGSYCAGAGLRSAIVNYYGVDSELTTTTFFYNLTSQVSPITNIANRLINDTSTNLIKEINSGVTYANIIDKNATQYHSGLKRSNYFDSAYSVQQFNAPIWQDIFDLYYDTTIPDDEKIFYVHWKILKGDLTNEPTVFPIKKDGIDYIGLADSTTNTIYYAEKPNISTYAFQSVLLDNYPPSLLSSGISTVIPSQTITVNTATSSYNISQKGIVGLVSGASLSPQSSVDRIIKPEFLNIDSLVLHSIQPSVNTQLTVQVKNLPSDYLIKVENPNLLAFLQYPIWTLVAPTADKSFSVDLPANHCVNIETADGTQDVKVWEGLGSLCASGSMPKTITYTQNLAFTFWTLPWGTSHVYDQDSESISTKVRHKTQPFAYNVNIFDRNGTNVFSEYYTSNSTGIDLKLFNLTGVQLPARLEISDDGNSTLYKASVGFPSYLSGVSSWFIEWFTIDGFNLLYMLPIIFAAMFTRNSVGIGTALTVVFIATLSWLGLIVIPELIIYLLLFISIVGLLAYRLLSR